MTRGFRRFQRKEAIDDQMLTDAIRRAERGLIDADLGVGLIKQRIARPNQGRRGGYRTVIAYRTRDRAVFLFGFAKSHLANISRSDQRDLGDFGAMLMALDEQGLVLALQDFSLLEVTYDGEA